MARRRLLAVLVLVTIVLGCTNAPDSRGQGEVLDPSPDQVFEALAFGQLAPLPLEGRVVALRYENRRDPWRVLAVRMSASAAEPYLVASGLGPLDRYSYAVRRTAYDQKPPDGTPATLYSYATNDRGGLVGREAAIEPLEDGNSLIHLWLYAL